MSATNKGIPARLWTCAFNIGLSSFLFGYCLSSLNTVFSTGSQTDPIACYEQPGLCPKGSMLNDLRLGEDLQQLATAMTILGAMIGGLFASYPSDHYGRRASLLVNNIFFIVGGILCGIPSTASLMIGRFLLGLSTGVESMIAPVLLSEIASEESRGVITSIHQLMITLGITASAVIGYFTVPSVYQGWKVVQFFTIAPAILQLLCFAFLPESPKWLIRNGRSEVAHATVRSLRNGTEDDINEEMKKITASLNKDMQLQAASWRETLSDKKAMEIGLLMMFFSAMTGINAVIFYSTTIFANAGVSEPILCTIAVDILNVVLTMLSGYLVDKLGRKILLITGTWIMFTSLLFLGIVLLFLYKIETLRTVVSILGVLTYVCGFAIGLGAVQWVVVSEVVKTRLRSKAYSLFVTTNWTANLFLALCLLSLINTFGGGQSPDNKRQGVAIVYLIFAAICAACLVFLYFRVPETKGTTADDDGDIEAAVTPSKKAKPMSPKNRMPSVEVNLLSQSSVQDDFV